MPSTKVRLRSTWFQVHKWLGLLLALLVVPISITGAALVWHDWLDEQVNPQRYEVSGPVALPPSAYAEAASPLLAAGERIASISFPKDQGPVVVAASRPAAAGAGRPVRTMLWLDPGNARVLDKAGSNEGAVRVLHMLHGSLMVPGMGRQIVGWIGVAMLISSLTGLWLWWPLSGSLARGLRWRRHPTTNANLHYNGGFWIAVPLAMLSFTGIWISFPPFFAAISGAEAPRPPQAGGAPRPIQAPALSVDAALAAARPHSRGPLLSISWPTDKAPQWTVAFAREGGPAEVKVADADRAVTPPTAPKPETIARTMRRLHDGTGMGPVWQTIIFLAGIIPALLAVTGIIMWLRTRGWRSDVARRRRARGMAAPAE